MLIPRHAEATLLHLARGYPVVAVTGPRQSGKTTLVRKAFPDKPYVSLEDLDERQFATDDPRGFLGRYPDGAILDEVQRCPELFSYLQTRLDQARKKGLFVLTGSQQFNLLSGITQSLAGRVALIPLLPFALSELQAAKMAPKTLSELLFRGLYPPISDGSQQPGIWYGNYMRTYIERDVRQVIKVRDLSAFQRFVRMCAGRTGQLTNLSALASDCGVTHNTAKAWLSVLEASYIVHLLQPHHRNFDKRLVKTPKLYFCDTGLACWLLGIRAPAQLDSHAQRGALFETWAVGELLKARYNRGLESNLYFWRDRSGNEVDVLIDEGDKLAPVEIKAGQTISGDYFRGLERWQAMAKKISGKPWLLYGGDKAQTRLGYSVVPWAEVGSFASQLAADEAV
jgi:hypothetical protein